MTNFPSSFPNSSLPGRLSSTDSFSQDERLYSALEISKRLGVSERWVRDHATRRYPRIPAIKLGPLVRFRWCDVQKFVAELAATNDSKRR